MATQFDPYRTWLGIPPEDQPPNYYRLLGIELLEDTSESITNAADRQMEFLKKFQAGQHAVHARSLVKEVQAAKLCLLDPQGKAAYDARLVEDLPEVDFVDEPEELQLPDDGLLQQAAVAPFAEATAPQSPTDSVAQPKRAAFGEYELLEQLDSSRTGRIFKARHAQMGRTVAVKILSADAQQSPQLLKRFRRKVKILARLEHQNLVAVYAAGQRAGTPYLVMEYIDGRNLSELVKQVGPLPVEHAVNYTMQAAAGLGYAHSRGVYHRNVKPANLMVNDHTGAIKIIGLGLARMNEEFSGSSIGERLTYPGTAMGTFDYMAPEQFVDAANVDHRADIYALGCTLYTLLTGQFVYPIKSQLKKALAHRDQPIPPLGAAREDVPPQLDLIYQKMLAKKASDRYESMEPLLAALQTCG
jgi:serine/threonine-protein kinase